MTPMTERIHFASAGAARRAVPARAALNGSHTFTYPFEELALFNRKELGNRTWFAGLLDGTFEVEVEPNGGWDIIEIHLHTENGVGAGKTFAVSRDDDRDLFSLLHDRLHEKYASIMPDMIAEELNDVGLRLEW